MYEKRTTRKPGDHGFTDILNTTADALYMSGEELFKYVTDSRKAKEPSFTSCYHYFNPEVFKKPYFEYDGPCDTEQETIDKWPAAYKKGMELLEAEYPLDKYPNRKILVADSTGLAHYKKSDKKDPQYKISLHFRLKGCGKMKHLIGLKRFAIESKFFDRKVYANGWQKFRIIFTSKEADIKAGLPRPLEPILSVEDDGPILADINDLTLSEFLDYSVEYTEGELEISTEPGDDIDEPLVVDKKSDFLPATAESLQELLECIPEEIAGDYDQWTKIIWGVRHESLVQGKEKRFKEIVHEISKTWPKYNPSTDRNKINKLWRSDIKAEGKGCRINTVHYYAMKNPEKYDEWKAKYGSQIFKPTLTTIRTTFYDDHIQFAKQSVELDSVKQWLNGSTAFIGKGGKEFVITMNDSYNRKTKERSIIFEHIKVKDFFNSLCKRCQIPNPDYDPKHPKKVPKYFNLLSDAVKYLYSVLEAKYFAEAKFVPYYDIIPDMKRDFNLFNGFHLLGTKGDKSIYENSTMFKVIEQQLCSGDKKAAEYLHKWIAHMIREPDEICGVCIIFVSMVHGIGKNTLIKLIKCLIGTTYSVTVKTSDDLLGRFNKKLQGKLFCHLEEMSDGKKVVSTHDTFKAQVTQEEISIEPKNLEQYEIDHRTRYLGVSNKEGCVYLENVTDRRFLPIRCLDKFVYSPAELRRINIVDLRSREFIESAWAYYTTLSLDGFVINKFPTTELRNERISDNQSSAIQWLMRGYFQVDTPGTPPQTHFKGSYSDLYQEYLTWCDRAKESQLKERTWAKKLKESGILTMKDTTTKITGYNHSKEELRDILRKALGDSTWDYIYLKA